MRKDFDQDWGTLATEVLTGMKEWRLQHPRATLREIELAVDEHLATLRARMLEDAALASDAADGDGDAAEALPTCPHCGSALESTALTPARTLTTRHERQVHLARRYWQCPACGAGIFPPR
jgi:hypothetical protein